MNFTFNQSHIFLKVVQYKSISRAAEALNLTQPAVSIQLKNFQDQFDVPLYEIVGRKFFITDFGAEIAKEVEKIAVVYENLSFKLQALNGKLVGKLNIATVSSGKYLVPYFLSKFIEKNEGH